MKVGYKNKNALTMYYTAHSLYVKMYPALYMMRGEKTQTRGLWVKEK